MTDTPTGGQPQPRGPGDDPPTGVLGRLGRSGWLVTGMAAGVVVTALTVAVLLPFLAPVIVAVVSAAVLRPAAEWMCRHGLRRTVAAVAATLLLPALLIALAVIVQAALRGQEAQWRQTATAAASEIHHAMGVDPVTPLVDAGLPQKLVLGVAGLAVQTVSAAVAVVFGALIAAYVLLFLLKDGPAFAAGIARRLPVPAATTRDLLGGADLRLRRYVLGTTVVAAMDTVVITFGSVVLSLPLVAVIALVTFVAAFVPYLGAWVSAIFVVLIALGAGGLDTALWMLGIVLVTQNLLEGILRPLAFGKALDMHPLAILAATAAGAVLGGLLGVFIAPPLVAILLFWYRTLRRPAA